MTLTVAIVTIDGIRRSKALEDDVFPYNVSLTAIGLIGVSVMMFGFSIRALQILHVAGTMYLMLILTAMSISAMIMVATRLLKFK
jgi:hypothetical protein